MISSQMQFEGLLLTGSPSDTFADFYRDCIRPQAGARLSADALKAAYAEWADERDLTTSSAKAVRAFMEANGHKHSKASTVYYKDAVLGSFEGQPVPARRLPVIDGTKVREMISVTVDDLDQLIIELQGARARLARAKQALLPKGRGL